MHRNLNRQAQRLAQGGSSEKAPAAGFFFDWGLLKHPVLQFKREKRN
jgi:hypothetical protein